MTKHYLISGKVQGVGFRAFTLDLARLFGLRGWVRNLLDGRVEALVQGEGGQIEQFESKLRTGPRLAEVEGFTSSRVVVESNLQDFEIIETGREVWSPDF